MEESKIAPVLNHNMDVGALVIEDCTGFENMSEAQIELKTKKNLCKFY